MLVSNSISVVFTVDSMMKMNLWSLDEEDDIKIYINVLNAQRADDLFSSLTSVHMKNVIWDRHEMLFIEFVCPRQDNLKYLVFINLDAVRNLMKAHFFWACTSP